MFIREIKTYLVFILFLAMLGCKRDSTLFKKLDASRTGIDFSNKLKESSDLNILNFLYYYNGSGVAAGDYNNDGLTDLYFTANEAPDKLYLNRGNFKFEDITNASGIINKDGWTTGISNVDINGDGLLDLYISKVSGYRGLEGHNLLFINMGNDSSGIPKFQEQSKNYGLDFSGFSTQAAFLDYDQDGDLDMYLLNHSVHPNRNYGKGSKREGFDAKSGDRLYRNENGTFKDVSAEAEIFQGVIGYGLGVAIGDLNNDLYPDIYVGNDFFENDYLYINSKDGRFKEIISSEPDKLGHTTHFSMGTDISDFNNDGWADILSLDMLPEDLETYKTSGLEYPFQTYSNFLKNGFAPQFMQNTLHINNGNLIFSETAFLSGIAASEWSWGGMFADFDNDTNKDLFITNGIKGATNDMDFIRFISNEKIQKELSSGKISDFSSLIKELPEKKVPNYFFRNMGNNTFKKSSEEWMSDEATFSHGFVYVDLDNDGDLDLVVNNMDENAGIFENRSSSKKQPNSYLKVDLIGDKRNSLGIGAKIFLYHEGKTQVQEHYLARGYLSSLAPGLHFGTGSFKKIDSVKVIWSNRLAETKYEVKTNSKIDFDIKNAVAFDYVPEKKTQFLTLRDSLLDHHHIEQSTLEFNREPLIPFGYANQSPRSSVADVNGDGYEDIIFGGGKSQALSCWIQNKDGQFIKMESELFDESSISEDSDHVLFDVDKDGDLDMIVVSGGNEFSRGKAIRPRLYINDNGAFKQDDVQFEDVELNASRVSTVDLNLDGFPDVCFTSNIVPNKYGKTPRQYLFLNDGKGNFRDVTSEYSIAFKDAGNVQDIVWDDINNDGIMDAIVVGHWMPVKIFLNDGKRLKELDGGLEKTHGWWNTVVTGDFDKDGDIDIVVGNWGLNSRLTASKDEPIRLYVNDFDANGSIDPVVSYFYKGDETAFSSKDELDAQMPYLKKKFSNYKDYAQADFSEVFPEDKLENAEIKEVYELGSYYFENLGNNSFSKRLLPFDCQVSPIFDMEIYDFNDDGYEDLLIVGNNHEVSTQLGRMDASHGTLLLNDRKGFFEVSKLSIPDISGSARNIEKISIRGEDHFIITRNNSSPLILKSNNSKK